MRVYLDACCLQRPLDDRSQPRDNLGPEAVLTILGMVENGDLELVSSQALEFEVERNPDSERRGAAKEILKLASETAGLVDVIETEAEVLVEAGFKPLGELLFEEKKLDKFAELYDDVRKHMKRTYPGKEK
jgi:hypothetical protein